MGPFLTNPLDATSKWILKACAAVALLVVAGLLVYGRGHSAGVESMQDDLQAEKALHQATIAEHAQVLRQYAERAAHVADLARQAQTTFIQDRDTAARKHEQELAHAAAEKNRLIAGYRAGAVQLQPWWECPSVLPAAGGFAGAGAAGGGPETDGAALLRAASLAEGVQDGIAADAWIRNLQTELTATRKACGARP